MTEYGNGYGKPKVNIADVESVKPEEISEEKIESIITSVMRKFDCPECGNKIMFQRISGHNARPECDECGANYVI